MIAALALTLASLTASPPSPAMLGGEKWLFLDDYYVASRDNLVRQVHPAEKSPDNPVLWPEAPWESPVAIIYGSVLHEDGLYRMWYHGGQGVSYAESKDGVAWTKPGLGLATVDGQDTNIVIERDADGKGASGTLPYFYELFGVHRNRDASDPAKRYVMGYLSLDRAYEGPRTDPFHGGQRRGLGVAYSADGIHWTLGENWATDAICDGATHWMFDPRREAYVLYGRTKSQPEALLDAWAKDEWAAKYFWGRAVARIESKNFLDWDFEEPATAPVVMEADLQDPPGTEIYSIMVFPYESVYIGLVQRFHNRPGDVYLDVQLSVSHDGVSFERVNPRTPFIPCGGIGAWDRFNQSLANNPPIVDGKDLRFYYGGRTYRHSPYDGPDKGVSGGGIGFATAKKDRFVSLGASFDGGTLTTVPLVMAGDTLHLNADCAFGETLVEVVNEHGAVIATSKPIRADGLDIAIEWEDGGLPEHSVPVSLRLTLKNALLYSLWCN